MKALVFILVVALSSCGPESSPEGRMTIKLEELRKQLDSTSNSGDLQKQVDSLKQQHAKLSDSVAKIRAELKLLKKN